MVVQKSGFLSSHFQITYYRVLSFHSLVFSADDQNFQKKRIRFGLQSIYSFFSFKLLTLNRHDRIPETLEPRVIIAIDYLEHCEYTHIIVGIPMI